MAINTRIPPNVTDIISVIGVNLIREIIIEINPKMSSIAAIVMIF